MLFKSKAERDKEKRERLRKKRSEEYQKRKEKQEKAERKQAEKDKKNSGSDDKNKTDSVGKFLDFMVACVSLFMPEKSRIDHHRLMKQGAVFGVCLVLITAGVGLSYQGYLHKQAIANAVQSFTTEGLQFSKTGTTVETSTKPFQTSDHKTVYIPLKITDMSNMEPDASKYHIIMIPKGGAEFKYHPSIIQLYSYGSTGNMFLVVKSADKIQNQIVQIIMWTGENLSNDSYDPDDDTDTSDSGLAKFKSKYDTLAFTINLGATSIKPVKQYKMGTVDITKRVKVDSGQTGSKKKGKKGKAKYINKIVKVRKKVPDPDGYDLYTDKKLQYIFNRMYTQKKLNKIRKSMHKSYSNMQININKINRDYSALSKAGYKMPRLPEWTTNTDNNLSNGLPLDIKQIDKLSMLNDPFLPTDKIKNKISDAYHNKKLQAQDNDDNDNQNTDNSKESKYIDSLTNMVIKDGKGNVLTSGSTADSNSSGSDAANNQWTDLQNAIQNIYDEKTSIYYEGILKIWSLYQTFQTDTSSGSSFNSASNTGAITQSLTSGRNKHGKYMLIANVPKVTDTKKKGK